MAKKAGASKARTRLLFRLARYFQPNQILELGTSLGIGTQALALGYPQAKITSIEGASEVAMFAQKQLQSLPNIRIINTTFDQFLKEIQHTHYDLVYIDGHHEMQATLTYFNTLKAQSSDDTVFILDDIHWSKGMSAAWALIKKLPEVTVTIDCFWFGLVFFRKEQVKQDFYLRL